MTVTEANFTPSAVVRWVPQAPQIPHHELQEKLVDTHELEEKLAMCHIMTQFGIVTWMNMVAKAVKADAAEFTITELQTTVGAELKAANDANHTAILTAGYGMVGLDAAGNPVAYASDMATTHQQANGQAAIHHNPGQYGQAGYQANPNLGTMARASAGTLMFGLMSRIAHVPPPGSQQYQPPPTY